MNSHDLHKFNMFYKNLQLFYYLNKTLFDMNIFQNIECTVHYQNRWQISRAVFYFRPNYVLLHSSWLPSSIIVFV